MTNLNLPQARRSEVRCLQNLGDLRQLATAYSGSGALLDREIDEMIQDSLDKAMDDVLQETKDWAKQHEADGRYRDAEFLYRRASFNESISPKSMDQVEENHVLPTLISIYEKMDDYPAAEMAQEMLLKHLSAKIPYGTTGELNLAVNAYVKMLSNFRERVLDTSFHFDKQFESCIDLCIVYRIAVLDMPLLHEVSLEQGLIILEPQDDPWTLHIAVKENAIHLARSLIENGAEIDKRDSLACTPLHRAAQYAEPEMLELLLDYGADIEAVDGADQTPLHRALHGNEDQKKLELLINAGVEMEATDRLGRTALMVTIRDDLLAVAQFLIHRGANVEKSYEAADTPLLLAVRYKRAWAIELLLENGARLTGRNVHGDTALHVAIRIGQESIIQILLDFDHGAMTKIAVDQQNAEDDTCLCRAVREANVSIVEMLLKAGADVNTGGFFGDTALHQAVKRDRDPQENIVHLLLTHSAPLDAVNDHGQTVFHFAIFYRRSDLISILIRHAEPGSLPIICGLRNRSGRTALDLAVSLAKNTEMHSDKRLILHVLESALGLTHSSI